MYNGIQFMVALRILQITLYDCVAVPYSHQDNGRKQGIKLWAKIRKPTGQLSSAAVQGTDVAVCGKDYFSTREMWFGHVLAFLECYNGVAWKQFAFLQWYKEVAHDDRTEPLKMARLKWASQQRRNAEGFIRTVNYTDIVVAEDILQPVFIQGDGRTTRELFFYNHFVQ